jgi:hypothetical protein
LVLVLLRRSLGDSVKEEDRLARGRRVGRSTKKQEEQSRNRRATRGWRLEGLRRRLRKRTSQHELSPRLMACIKS